MRHTSWRAQLVAMMIAIGVLIVGCGSNDDAAGGPTEAEYRAAVQSEADCVAAEGFEVTPVVLHDDGYSYTYSIVSTGDADPISVQSACATQVGTVEITDAYLQTLRLTGAESERALAALVVCLGDLGISGLPDHPTDSTVLVNAIVEQLPPEEQGDAWLCMDRYRLAWPPGDRNFP